MLSRYISSEGLKLQNLLGNVAVKTTSASTATVIESLSSEPNVRLPRSADLNYVLTC